MFQSLFTVYSRLKRPSSLLWLNTWTYSKMNSWVFLSNELLSFFIESVKGFKSVTTTVISMYPYLLYKLVVVIFLLVQIGLIFG